MRFSCRRGRNRGLSHSPLCSRLTVQAGSFRSVSTIIRVSSSPPCTVSLTITRAPSTSSALTPSGVRRETEPARPHRSPKYLISPVPVPESWP